MTVCINNDIGVLVPVGIELTVQYQLHYLPFDLLNQKGQIRLGKAESGRGNGVVFDV